jgi:homoserine dehydrogenase
LNGVDVARKVTILARLAGLRIELSDVSVENMVPQELRTVASSEEFMQKLLQFDEEFDRMNQEALKQQCVLRYVGVIDFSPDTSLHDKCKVVIKKYPFDHPFAQLKGSDNIIAFTTKRFQQPLIIQGAGAGAQVTAHGIMSDLVKIADCVHFHAHQ